MTTDSRNTAASDNRALISDALTEARQLLALLEAATSAATRASAALSSALEHSVQQGVEALPAADAPASAHRREHRSGPPAKIDNDPELAAFIRARIDRLTFVQIADAVAAHFPAQRHVKRSAIHAWWQRNRPPKPKRRSPRTSPVRPG